MKSNDRDNKILELHMVGITVGNIADRFSLSTKQVRRILTKKYLQKYGTMSNV